MSIEVDDHPSAPPQPPVKPPAADSPPQTAISSAKRAARRRRVIRSGLSHAALLTLSVIFMIPFAWLVCTSLKSESHMNRFPPEWIPQGRYVEVSDGQWAEVVREEIVEYAPEEFDADGRTKPRVRLKSKVNLVDLVGDPWPVEPIRIVDSSSIVDKQKPTLRHYFKGLSSFSFDLFLQNTLFIAVIAVAGTVLSSSWVAFGFAILEWPGRNKVFWLMLATMMLPGQVTMVPLFLIFKHLGWINTYLPLLVPAFMGNAFFIFLLRQFFLTIPRDLIDAARVDGCSTFRIYWQIVMPLSVPALATVALFTFLASWNDFMGPLIYIVDEARYTLSLGLAMFRGRFMTRYGELMAVSTLMTIPIIVLFFFTQKTFIQGIKTSGMKN
jgi:multiple sugar transport system permease protein